MKRAPKPGDPGGQFQKIQGWDAGHDSVLGDMKRAILSDLILQRPNSDRRFYLKTNFSSKGYGAALCQADNSEESITAEQREDDGAHAFSISRVKEDIFVLHHNFEIYTLR